MVKLKNHRIGLTTINAWMGEQVLEHKHLVPLENGGLAELVPLLAAFRIVGIEPLGAFVVAGSAVPLKSIL